MSEVAAVRLRPLCGVRPFLYTSQVFNLCWDVRATLRGFLPKGLTTNNQQEKCVGSVYMTTLSWMKQWAKWFPLKRSSTTGISFWSWQPRKMTGLEDAAEAVSALSKTMQWLAGNQNFRQWESTIWEGLSPKMLLPLKYFCGLYMRGKRVQLIALVHQMVWGNLYYCVTQIFWVWPASMDPTLSLLPFGECIFLNSLIN